jgi:hypothetical protein
MSYKVLSAFLAAFAGARDGFQISLERIVDDLV